MLRQFAISRRAAIAGIAGALALPLRRTDAQEEPAASPGPAVVYIDQLIFNARVQLDINGRIQLAYVLSAPNSDLPHEFLYGPFTAIVDSGSFQVQIGDAPAETFATGDRFEVPEGQTARARNNLDSEGLWLMLIPLPREEWGRALELEPPPGLQIAVLVHWNDLPERLEFKRVFVDRIGIKPGAEYEVINADIELPELVSLVGLTGETMVVHPDNPSEDETLPSSGLAGFIPSGNVILRNSGSDMSVLLVIRRLPDILP